MKLKSKPVTNSSSVSYNLWGVWLDEDDVTEKLLEWMRYSYKKIGRNFDEDLKDHSLIDLVGTFIEEKTTLDVGRFEEAYHIIVGNSPFDMEDTQTPIKYKQKICSELEKIGIKLKPDKLNRIEESVYNG